MTRELLQWHPGFYAVFDLEIKDKAPGLRLRNEYTLGKKPIVIDLLATGEEPQSWFSKNIMRIFRKHNIIEYKSPKKSLRVNDYYKVMAYACYYIANGEHVLEIEPGEVTITFVCNCYPQKLIRHLQEEYGITIENSESGIYYLKGSRFLTQFIINHELEPKKNLWLYSLRGGLTDEEIEAVVKDYKKHKNEKSYEAAMDLITKANWKKMKEEKEMCEALRELCKEIYADEWRAQEELCEARGEQNKIISLIKKKLAKGKSEEVIADELEEEVSVIHELITQLMPALNG